MFNDDTQNDAVLGDEEETETPDFAQVEDTDDEDEVPEVPTEDEGEEY